MDYLKSLIEVLPDKPGVYQFFDSNGEIIYIGKAASLKKRVSSYFSRGKHDHFKIKVLVISPGVVLSFFNDTIKRFDKI